MAPVDVAALARRPRLGSGGLAFRTGDDSSAPPLETDVDGDIPAWVAASLSLSVASLPFELCQRNSDVIAVRTRNGESSIHAQHLFRAKLLFKHVLHTYIIFAMHTGILAFVF